MDCSPLHLVCLYQLKGFNEDSFRQMCILSGCDYLPSVPGMGLSTANKLMKKFGKDPQKVSTRFNSILSLMKFYIWLCTYQLGLYVYLSAGSVRVPISWVCTCTYQLCLYVYLSAVSVRVPISWVCTCTYQLSVRVPISCVCICTCQVIVHLKMQKGKSVPKNYTQDFQRAEHTFLYQLVFDPRIQKQVRLSPLPDHVNPAEFEFAGTYPHEKCFPIFLMYLPLYSLTAA